VLRLKREWHELNDILATLPEIGDQDQMAANVVKLSHLGLPDTLLSLTPAELTRTAKDTIDRNTAFKKAIEEFRPALGVFGLDGFYPVSRLDILATAVLAPAQIPDQYQSPMREHLTIDEERFAEFYGKWLVIRKADKYWLERLPGRGRQWPQSSSIRGAAETLNKNWIQKAMVGLNGSAKAARQLLEGLGFDSAAIMRGDVERLAAHIDALDRFENDKDAATLFGTSWRGIATPFDEIANGLKAREILRNQIGADATQCLSDTVQAINRHVDAARQLHHAIQDFDDLVDNRSVDLAINLRSNEITVMAEALTLIGQWNRSFSHATIHEILKAAKLKLRFFQLRRAIDASPLKCAAEDLGASIAKIECALAALDWVLAVRKVPMPAPLLQRLTSSVAAEERSRLKIEADRATQLYAEYKGVMKAVVNDFGMVAYANLELTELSKSIATLIEHKAELPDFIALTSERQKLISIGLEDFIVRADQNRIGSQYLPQILTALVADRRAEITRKISPELVKNTGAALNTRRKQFAEKDRAKIENDRLTVKARLLTRMPLPGSNYGKKKEWTEMALIKVEMEKQRRFVPVRSLLARAGNSIRALKPCFMMSPLSLAKFMKPGVLNFDLLVIDEASQMRPEDALGAIFRSNQIVVVGDPKQLPPTDFFSRSMNADLDEKADDLDDESILDSCQKTFGQRRSLKWHYRSQCESLIRFSNENFYQGGLITFPAAKGSFSIDLVRVNGAYQARCNAAEATCVAEQSVLFMQHHADADEEDIPTLGIVAVNTEQRDLIQEELRRMIADDPQVDKYREKVANKGEELFVKNLENVQGDERDFIFVSMTYGFEPGATAMKQRFGPINGKQGHRRLNVLFSRARIRIGLFTSFGSIDVVLTDTSADGVHILRKYLEYAEVRGRSAVDGIGSAPESNFETEVADRLRAKNFVVDYQVGVSNYRIDLGDFPEQYLVGIECDGARYHSSKSARDRDRIREEVLQSKGWNLIRVWSTDWFDNADIQTERLVQKIAELCKKVRPNCTEYPSLTTAQSTSQDTSYRRTNGILAETKTQPDPTDNRNELSALPDVDMSPEDQCIHDLNHLRDNVISVEMDNWQPHRSILRGAMIEAFVRQKVVDPAEWFLKIPAYLRQSTNPIEKRYLEQICEIVSRLEKARQPTPRTHQQFPFNNGSRPSSESGVSRIQYVLATFVSDLARPDPSRFYEPEYRSTLVRMIEHVINVEAPIYQELLIERIARAHGFQRSGEKIQAIVSKAVPHRFPRTHDDGRTVLWPENAKTAEPYPYRESPADVRSQTDIPIADLRA
jgi:very-short-patch-repair endonuclease